MIENKENRCDDCKGTGYNREQSTHCKSCSGFGFINNKIETTYYENLNVMFPDVFQNLEVLSEECAEVIQIKSKITRFGLNNYNPVTKVINRQTLLQEISDVLAMIDILKANGILCDDELEEYKRHKIKKLNNYYKR